MLTRLVVVLFVVVAALAGTQTLVYFRVNPADAGAARILVQRPVAFGPDHPAEFDLSAIATAGRGVRLVVHLSIAAESGPDYCVMDSRLSYRVLNAGAPVMVSTQPPKGRPRFTAPPLTIRRAADPVLYVSVTTDPGCTLAVDPTGTQATPR